MPKPLRFSWLLCALALSSGAFGVKTDAPTLSARGPYRVGVRTVNALDAARKRQLKLEVWYPAQLSAEAEQTVYRSTVGATPYALAGQAGRDAPALEGAFPLLVYSHGQPGARMQAAYLLEHLASEGFVVAAIDHPNSTYADLTQQSYISSLVDRPLDILATVTAVPKVISSAEANNVGLIGYSYGGYSVLNAAGIGLDGANLKSYCQQSNSEGPCFVQPFFAPLEAQRGHLQPDPRIKAVLALAPYGGPWLSPQALTAMRLPLFIGVGSADTVATPERDGISDFKRSGSSAKYLLTLQGATHNPWIVCPPEIRAAPTDWARCSEPDWDHADSHALTQHFATAFFGLYLQGKSALGAFLTPALSGIANPSRVNLERGP